MDFLLTFLEGLASFISPCMLPMIPLYLSYFAGDNETDGLESRSVEPEDNVKKSVEETTQIKKAESGSAQQEAIAREITDEVTRFVEAEENVKKSVEETTQIIKAESGSAPQEPIAREITDEVTRSVEPEDNVEKNGTDITPIVATENNAEKQTNETTQAVADKKSKKANKKKYRALIRSLFFVFGFTLMFVVFGGLVGLISGYISKYKKVINIVAGVIVIIFGLSYIGLFGLPFFKGLKKTYKINGVWSAFLFGIVFAVGVGPCTGAFLGSALALASASGTVMKGILLLLFYSLGIGIPFIVTAILTDKTKKLFGFIKRHFKVIKIVSGSLLVVMGVLMAAGVMDKIGAILS